MTQKRIAVVVDVPDGATHYYIKYNRFVWYKLNSDVGAWWDGVAGVWRRFLDGDFPKDTIEIEVIE